MAEVHLDHPGDIRWYPDAEPLTAIGPCPHTQCTHEMGTTVAEGPDYDHYTLTECNMPEPDGCGGKCRAWLGEYRDGPPWWRFFAYRQVRP